MKGHRVILVSLLFAAAPAFAQVNPPGQQQPPAGGPVSTPLDPLSPRVGMVDFGFRVNAQSGDPALLQEFRDLRDGPTINTFRYERTREDWQFEAAIDNLGYRDQHYYADFNRFGRLRATFEWTSLPWFHSTLTRTLFQEESNGVLRLPDSIQSAVQGGQATLRDVADAGVLFDSRLRRDIADARVAYAVNEATDLRVSFTSTGRSGEQPWGAGFGFTAANEVGLPIDQRTNDLNASVQWAAHGRIVQVGYFGSFYDNQVPVLVWDSPLALSDAPGNPGQGRMPIFPSSTAHTVSALASTPLPARSRLHAYVSIGTWNQDEPLVPHTINTAIPQPELSRTSAGAEARIVALNIGYVTRAFDRAFLTARFRIYDFDNQTPPFEQPLYVRADQSVNTSTLGASEPFGYTRTFLDLNAVYTGFRYFALRGGYSMEHDDRTHRFLEETTDHVLRASVDSQGVLPWLMVRAQYEHAERSGDGFDQIALDAINEQVSLRQFDIADRVRDRLSVIFQATPNEIVGVTANVGWGRDDRDEEFFGLLDNTHQFYTVAVDVTPTDLVAFGLSYGREMYDTLQRSRQANSGAEFVDPSRDWNADGDEDFDTISANVNLTEIAPYTGVRVTYDYTRGRSRYVYLLAPNSPLVPPQQLPPVEHSLHRLQSDVTYDISDRIAVGLSYWFDRLYAEDFAQAPATLDPFGIAGSGLYLGYMFLPSTLHTTWLRLIYRW